MNTPAERHLVTLKVPNDQRYQLVYQKDFRKQDIEEPSSNPTEFILIPHALEALKKLPLLTRTFGRIHALKVILKTFTGRRHLYGTVLNDTLVHHGWLSFGFCNHYHVEKEHIIIGSIWTSEKARGRGLATIAIAQAMRHCFDSKDTVRTFHIDTASDNIACQKVISRLGFGEPVAIYLRGQKNAPHKTA